MNNDAASGAASGLLGLGVMGMFLIGLAALYIIFSLPLYVIAQKLGSEMAWLAFIPIANLWLMCDVAGKEWWWILLMFIPFINIIIFIMLWMAIAENLDQPSWLGLLLLVPIANIIMPFYLAFASQPQKQRY